MVTSYFYENCLPITKKDVDNVYELIRKDGVWKNIPMVRGAKRGLTGLAKIFEIFIITARPVDSEGQTKEFLKNCGMPIKEIYFIDETQRKLEIIKELSFGVSAFVEDRLDFASEIARAGIDTYLLDYPWNRTDEKIPNLYRVKNWKQIGNILNGKGGKKQY